VGGSSEGSLNLPGKRMTANSVAFLQYVRQWCWPACPKASADATAAGRFWVGVRNSHRNLTYSHSPKLQGDCSGHHTDRATPRKKLTTTPPGWWLQNQTRLPSFYLSSLLVALKGSEVGTACCLTGWLAG